MRSRLLGRVGLVAVLLGSALGCGSTEPAERDEGRGRDREAIRDTLQRYAIDLDDGRVEAFLDLFTEDAVFTAAEFVYAGRDAIRTELAIKPRGPGKHLPFPAVIEFEDEHAARAWSDFLRVKQGRAGDPGSWVITSVGRYYDRLVRGDDGRWRIERRDVQILEMANLHPLVEPGGAAKHAASDSVP
ncbi:MAG: nuclear transport factor 2 family protein [Myxococcota bacterium]